MFQLLPPCPTYQVWCNATQVHIKTSHLLIRMVKCSPNFHTNTRDAYNLPYIILSAPQTHDSGNKRRPGMPGWSKSAWNTPVTASPSQTLHSHSCSRPRISGWSKSRAMSMAERSPMRAWGSAPALSSSSATALWPVWQQRHMKHSQDRLANQGCLLWLHHTNRYISVTYTNWVNNGAAGSSFSPLGNIRVRIGTKEISLMTFAKQGQIIPLRRRFIST